MIGSENQGGKRRVLTSSRVNKSHGQLVIDEHYILNESLNNVSNPKKTLVLHDLLTCLR